VRFSTYLHYVAPLIGWPRVRRIIDTMLALVFLSAGILSGGSVYDRDGRRVGEIRESPYGGGVDIYDPKGNRIGDGRVSPYDGSIRVYDPKSQKPLYEIRPDRRTR